ncbi:MAG TPA: polymer-forming cytoskeletal protein, partial [Chloroflexota bacterium]|nr:polymer-forming cytoskeletal protein [Chloroflexota bacterium]
MVVPRPGAGLLAVVLASLLALPPAQAPASATFGGGEVYELPAGAVVPKDLYVIASEATIDGTVEGDVAVVARRVRLTGTVKGNTNIVAARIEITGRTAGIVRTVGAAQIIPPPPG